MPNGNGLMFCIQKVRYWENINAAMELTEETIEITTTTVSIDRETYGPNIDTYVHDMMKTRILLQTIPARIPEIAVHLNITYNWV